MRSGKAEARAEHREREREKGALALPAYREAGQSPYRRRVTWGCAWGPLPAPPCTHSLQAPLPLPPFTLAYLHLPAPPHRHELGGCY